MIVVIGSPSARASEGAPLVAAGLGAEIAVAAAAAGAAVQVVGKVGEDPAGEAVLLDLARRGVRHVAVLRDSARPTPLAPGPLLGDEPVDADVPSETPEPPVGASTVDAEDLQLALSYLPEYSTIVVAEGLADDALRVVVDAAAWAGASLVVIGELPDGADLPAGATVFAAPDDGDPDGAFAAMVGAYAAGIDRGDDPKAAFATATATVGSSPTD